MIFDRSTLKRPRVVVVMVLWLAALSLYALPGSGTATDGGPPPSAALEGDTAANQRKAISEVAMVPKAPTTSAKGKSAKKDEWKWNMTQVFLATLSMVFGLLALLLVKTMEEQSFGRHGKDTLFGLVFMFTIAIFLIPAGYSEEQINPVVALIGAAIGYLFGRNKESSPGGEAPREPAPDPKPAADEHAPAEAA